MHSHVQVGSSAVRAVLFQNKSSEWSQCESASFCECSAKKNQEVVLRSTVFRTSDGHKLGSIRCSTAQAVELGIIGLE